MLGVSGSIQWGTVWSRDERCARHVFYRPIALQLLCNAGLSPIIPPTSSKLVPQSGQLAMLSIAHHPVVTNQVAKVVAILL